MLKLELDHFFILTDKPKETGDLLVEMGLTESFSRDHLGQGTSNRRFEFCNGMLELLYVRCARESNNGPAKNLKFPERVDNKSASPFGIILTRTEGSSEQMPFDGWKYQPDFFPPPKAFHVGNNSEILAEPLCFYVPFLEPITRKVETGQFKSISHLKVSVPVHKFSPTLTALNRVERLQLLNADNHFIELTLDQGQSGLMKDFRPELPLIIKW